MEKYKEQIKEVNEEISGALNFWQEMLLTADADKWAYLLEYSDKDLLNAFYIFNHVAQNKAIKNGTLTLNNASEKMFVFKNAIKECFGFDTMELTNNVLFKGDGNN